LCASTVRSDRYLTCAVYEILFNHSISSTKITKFAEKTKMAATKKFRMTPKTWGQVQFCDGD